MLMTALNSIFLVIYLLSATVQYNDPDALPWIIVYLLAAGMCVLQYRSKQQRLFPRALLVVCLLPRPGLGARSPWQEQDDQFRPFSQSYPRREY